MNAKERLQAAQEEWRKIDLARAAQKSALRRAEFHTDSGIPIPDLLSPADLADPSDAEVEKYLRDVGFPGQFPYTRGPQPSMYRGRLWTMRQFAGFGTPEDTNQRFKYLLEHGMTGLSTAFDMPALMGYDADHPMSRGEVGKEGVAVSTLKDFEVLFSGIPLDRVTTSMTINASAIFALCAYIAVAEEQGVSQDKLGAKKAISVTLRTHAQTAGVALTAQQPYNNVVRVALQALAAVLGGTQSLHTNSLDETYALPTEEAATIALRTQQILAHESGVDRVVDPLAGSYFVEYLTDETETRAMEILGKIERYGGIIRAIEEGYPQREIADSAYQWQREVDSGERKIVGVNSFRTDRDEPIVTLKIDDQLVHHQVERLNAVRRSRSQRDVQDKLRAVEDACRGDKNLMHPVLDAVKAYCTLGEVCDVFRKVWGAYREKGSF